MKQILIIEDDTDINMMLQKLLSFHGYEVVSAYSGTEGILLHNEKIDLILLDLMLKMGKILSMIYKLRK